MPRCCHAYVFLCRFDSDMITDLDKHIFSVYYCNFFSYPSFLNGLGAQKNHLIETVVLSTHNICFC